MTPFGTTRDGETVHRIVLSGGGLTVGLLTLGAIVQSVRLEGVEHDLTIGSTDLADYETSMGYHGAIVGPVANRLRQAQAPIGGVMHHFDANQDGTHALHGGKDGTHAKLWTVADHGPVHATLTLDLAAGDGGYPGNRHIRATFRLLPDATLQLEITGTTDAPTLMNLANHSYWTLDGGPTWAGHDIRVAADHYLPIDDAVLPTGEIALVEGTPFDLRRTVSISPGNPAVDHNFCLSVSKQSLRDVLWLNGSSGVSMTVATTEPGVQVFDGRPGYRALAIEAQGWPDAPNVAAFPSVEVTPDVPYSQTTQWRFSTG
ncbi:aldose epimerase family protein [Flavimaricola marinus]|uniref:Aldose 1-epimerase n=1 Tax=Flavimaricola marinus TaxID=1819565 RepID=A0A238LBC8_9RHOB|nr:aldose epimerase family protein [Flavimaricola marinus]SMY06714.1 Aldose 1-epimerase precursor [Flavimaricola marinus]